MNEVKETKKTSKGGGVFRRVFVILERVSTCEI
jgi:hypothetical protein